MPEEQNRVLTDHLASYLFCPSETAVKNLRKEGITEGVYMPGDIMLDALIFYRTLEHDLSIAVPNDFYLITLHRTENTDDSARLKSIIEALNDFEEVKGILPLHPRTAKMLEINGLQIGSNIQVIEPVGYLDMLALENRSQFIVTDSGGVQKEAYFLRKPCVTLRDQTEWVETVELGANILVGADRERIIKALTQPPNPIEWVELYGDGSAGETILELLLKNAG